MDQSIERKIARVEEKPPLNIDNVDFHLAHPEQVRQELGPTFLYFQRVEALVAGASLEALLPNSDNDYTGRFINAWVRDEQVHGQAFGILLGKIGLQGIEPTPDIVPAHNKLAGWIAERSEWLHGVLEMAYHTTGALHEKLTAVGYKRLETLLSDMGETALVETMIKPIERDEATHLGYYRTAANHLAHSLLPSQRKAAGQIVRRSYAPVGAGDKQDKPAFGLVLQALAGTAENISGMVEPIQKLADELLLPNHRANPLFVEAAMHECLEATP